MPSTQATLRAGTEAAEFLPLAYVAAAPAVAFVDVELNAGRSPEDQKAMMKAYFAFNEVAKAGARRAQPGHR